MARRKLMLRPVDVVHGSEQGVDELSEGHVLKDAERGWFGTAKKYLYKQSGRKKKNGFKGKTIPPFNVLDDCFPWSMLQHCRVQSCYNSRRNSFILFLILISLFQAYLQWQIIAGGGATTSKDTVGDAITATTTTSTAKGGGAAALPAASFTEAGHRFGRQDSAARHTTAEDPFEDDQERVGRR